MKKFRGNVKRSAVALLATSLAVVGLQLVQAAVGTVSPAKADDDPAGFADESFAINGGVHTNFFAPVNSTVSAMGIASHDRPVVAFQQNAPNSPTSVNLIRLTTDGGNVDGTFGDNGSRVIVDLKNNIPTLTRVYPRDIYIDAQDRIYLLSQVSDSVAGPSAFNVTLFDVRGTILWSVNRNFATSGIGEAYAIAVSTNNIFVAGAENAVAAPNKERAVIRMFLPDMSPTNAQSAFQPGGTNEMAVWRDMKIDAGGKLVVTGNASDQTETHDVIIHRYIPQTSPASITADPNYAVANSSHRYDFGNANEFGSAIDVAPDGRVAVSVTGVTSGTTAVGGLIQLDPNGAAIAGWNGGSPQFTFGGSNVRANSVAYDRADPTKIWVSGGQTATFSFLTRFRANGTQELGSPVGTTWHVFGQNVTVLPLLALDAKNRPVTAATTDGNSLSIKRWTNDQTPAASRSGKLLFDDFGGPSTRRLYGMDLAGSDLINVNNLTIGNQSMTQPHADQGGRLFMSFKNGSGNGGEPYVMATGADGGTQQIAGTPPGGFNGVRMTRPSTAFVNDDVVMITGAGSCVQYSTLPVGSGFTALADIPGGPLCGVTDAEANPAVGAGQVAYVKNGKVWLTYGNEPDKLFYDGGEGAATRVTWGYNGEQILFNRGPDKFGTSIWPAGTYANSSQFVVAYGSPAAIPGANISGFVFDPDGGAPYEIYYSSGDSIYAYNTGETPVKIFTGVSPAISQWQRNLSIFAPDGDVYDLSTPSIKASDVPLQSKAPANNGVQTAGLLNLNLFRSPLLNLNLFRSPLLNLNLFRSPLLNLNLFRSGLLNLNLFRSPLVNSGLKRTSLASLPIREEALAQGGGWIDRIKRINTQQAQDLARLPLVQITLADVAELGDTFDMPGLGDVDLSHSVFGTVSVMPFLLGNTTVANIDGIEWCKVFEARNYPNCGRALAAVNPTTGQPLPGDGLTATLLSLQVAGFNLDNLPTTSGNHINDLRAVHWEDLTLDSEAILDKFVLNWQATADYDAGNINTEKTSVGSALVKNITPSIDAVVWCVGATGIPTGVTPVDCTNASTDTVHKAFTQGALKYDTTVKQLGSALDGLSVNEIALGLWGEPGDDPYDQPPATLGINSSSNSKTYVISYARLMTGQGQSSNPRFDVDLPNGVIYTPLSARYIDSRSSQSEIGMPDPIVTNNGKHLAFEVASVNFDGFAGGFLQVLFDTTPDPAVAVSGQAVVTFDDGFQSQNVDSSFISSTEANETGDDTVTAANILPDTLYFGRITDKNDIDYYKIPTNLTQPNGDPIPEGSTLTVFVSQLQYDVDAVLYHAAGSDLSEDPMRPPGNDPAIQAESDPGQKVYNAGEPLLVEGESDIPLLPNLPVAGVSNKRGNKGERIEAITWGSGQPYVVQVSGFAGAHGTDTYAVRYTVTPPPVPPASAPRTGFTNPTATMPPALTAGDNPETVILTNMPRIERLYPGTVAGSNGLQQKVNLLKQSTNAVVIPVEGLSAYTAWDQNPQDPDLANAVVTQINSRVDTYLGAKRAGIKSMIIVGSDEIIPMGRVPDLTQTGNERTFAQELRETAAGDNNNALLGAALAGRILSDDPYGAFEPRAYGGTWLYVPDVALGRLVETPAQIGLTIDEFRTPQDANTPAGMIRPTSTLSAGYDFMRRVTADVTAAFNAQLPGLPHTSLVDTWDDQAILSALGNAGNTPTLISLNAHYSPYAFAPAAGKANVTASQVAAAANLRRRLLFTMGCHSGFNVTNILQTGTDIDFAEAMAAEPVSAFVGNTGYGIGLEGLSAFSQYLFSTFAYRLGQTTLGGALQQAKQDYLANGIRNPYDYKVVAQAVFFGIPNYKLVGATPVTPPPPSPLPTVNPGNGNVKTSSLTISQPTSGSGNQWTLVTDPTTGDQHYEIAGGGLDTPLFNSVQPTVVRDVTVNGEVASGAFVTSMKIAGDTANFNPRIVTPVLDSAAAQPEASFENVISTANPVQVTSFNGPDGDRQRVVTTLGQFTSTGLNSAGEVIGTERRLREVGYDVVYRPANATDKTKPIMTNPRALKNAANTEFSVTVTDFESDVARVAVLYRADGSNDFVLGNLTRSSTDPVAHSSEWVGTFPVTGNIDYAIQALNSQALVGWTANGGNFYNEIVRPVEEKTISATYSRAFDSGNAFYTTSSSGSATPVTVFFAENPSGGVASYKINGGALQSYNSTNGVVLTTAGNYHIDVFASDGTKGSFDVILATRPAEVVSITYDRLPDVSGQGIYTSAVTATVNTSDPSSTITIKADAETTYTARTNNAVTFTTDGLHTLRYRTSRGTNNDPPANAVTVKVDLNAPTVNFTQPSTDGQTYTVGQSVTAGYTCPDTFPASCTGTPMPGGALDTATPTGFNQFRTVNVTATDQAGRTTQATQRYRVVTSGDTVAATIDGAPISGIYTANKTVRVTSAQFNVVSATVDGQAVTTTPNGDGSYSFNVSGNGNHPITYSTSGASGSALVKIDTVNPIVDSVTTPVEGATYALNQAVTAVFTCSDTNLTSCQANGQNSGAATVPTNSVGAKTFTITATDAVGKTGTRIVNYSVVADTFDVKINGAAPNSGWYTETPAPGPKVTVKSTLNRPLEIWLDNGVPTSFAAGQTAELTVTAEGTHTVTYRTPEFTSSPIVIKVDRQLPVVTLTSPATGDPLYLNGSARTAAFACSDSNAIASCTASVKNLATGVTTPVSNGGALPTTTDGNFEVKAIATDVAGRTAEVTRTYRVATDGISADKASGTYTAATTVSFTSLLGNAITVTVDKTNAPTATNIYTFAPGAPASVTLTDGDYHVTYSSSSGATGTPLDFVVDEAAPTITAVTPAAGTPNYLRNQVVNADYSCADTHLVGCAAPVANGSPIDTSSFGAKTFDITATDAAGRSVTIHRPYNVVDQLSVSVTGPQSGSFYIGATTLHVASLGGSPVFVTVNGVETGYPSGTADVVFSIEDTYNISYRTDIVGGPSGVLQIKLDLTGPKINFTNPSTGTPAYIFGQNINALYTCSDVVAGIASCNGSQASGTPLNTSSVTGAGQTRNVSVTATDNAGKTTTDSRNYTVKYADGTACEGSISHRLNGINGPVIVPNSGQVITLLFRLCDANGVAIGNDRYGVNTIPSPVESNGSGVKGYCGPVLGLLPLCLPLLSPRDNSFTYQPSHEWRFRHDTSGLSVGDHTFFINLLDGTKITYVVRVQP